MTSPTPPAYRPCPDPDLCAKGDACAGQCSQPLEAEYVNGEAIRTGRSPADIMEEMNRGF